MLKDFSEAMSLSEVAHDERISEETAGRVLEDAINFLEEATRILSAPREWFEKPAPRLPPKKRKR